MSSQVQNGSSCFTGLPQELTNALCKGLSPTDVDINRMAAALLLKLNQETTEDLKVWENAIESLHISLPLKDRVGERSPKTRVKNLQDSIDGYYQHLNDAFLLYFNRTKAELFEDQEEVIDEKDEIKEGEESFKSSPPEELNQGILSHAKYNEVLRNFIRENKESLEGSSLFALMMLVVLPKKEIAVLKMLLDEGVKPLYLDDVNLAEENSEKINKVSLAWRALIFSMPGFMANPDYCKLILDYDQAHELGIEELNELLRITCFHTLIDSETRSQQCEVIRLFLKRGAKCDEKLISDLEKSNDKSEIIEFLRSKQ